MGTRAFGPFGPCIVQRVYRWTSAPQLLAAPRIQTTSAESSETLWGLRGHDRVTLFRGAVHAKVKGHAVKEGSSAACCALRSSATRARFIRPQRRPAGGRLRCGACCRGWRGSEWSLWALLPSETVGTIRARPGVRGASGVGQEQLHQGRLLLLRLLGLPGATCCPPPSAVWWVYARVRHPKAAFGTASSNMQRRTACFDPVLTAVLPARPPAALEAA